MRTIEEMLIDRGRAEGLAKGRTEGRTEGRIEGMAEGRAQSVLRILEIRRIFVD